MLPVKNSYYQSLSTFLKCLLHLKNEFLNEKRMVIITKYLHDCGAMVSFAAWHRLLSVFSFLIFPHFLLYFLLHASMLLWSMVLIPWTLSFFFFQNVNGNTGSISILFFIECCSQFIKVYFSILNSPFTQSFLFCIESTALPMHVSGRKKWQKQSLETTNM